VNIAQHLEVSARHHANRPALIAGERRWTYRELDEAASALAGGFAALGLKPGERLGLHLPNWPEFVLSYKNPTDKILKKELRQRAALE
jgi:long-chain acyl-CoA synthetase